MTAGCRDVAGEQAVLVAALRNPACYPHPAEQVEVIETHISYVLLSGAYAYKIKKAVALGFLDFSTLARRRMYCEEELRLNRRLAPELYLAVVAITGPPDVPRFAGNGEAIEYAVQMTRFSQEDLLDRQLAVGCLSPDMIDQLADQLADFHGGAERAPPDGRFGSPEAVWEPMAQNFAQLGKQLSDAAHRSRLADLEAWSRKRFSQLAGLLATRLRDGWIRECHGDLHLGNIARTGAGLRIFDCIEFDPGLRWIDVLNEIAFLTMDLEERGRADYGHRLLNRYLEANGDYSGLPLLAFYTVYPCPGEGQGRRDTGQSGGSCRQAHGSRQLRSVPGLCAEGHPAGQAQAAAHAWTCRFGEELARAATAGEPGRVAHPFGYRAQAPFRSARPRPQ